MAKARRFTFDTTVGKREAEVRVTYSMTPGRPEQGPTYACGGQPAEPPEIEIVSVKQNGKEVFLSDDEMETLEQEAWNRAEDDWRDEQAAEADWRYQEYRDRQLMAQWEREA